jgi:hypothetical protein
MVSLLPFWMLSFLCKELFPNFWLDFFCVGIRVTEDNKKSNNQKVSEQVLRIKNNQK